jgi:hypothetical protein
MINSVFQAGLRELGLFFKSFKPTEDQQVAWYGRLRNFTEETYRLGIYRITEDSKTAPGYADIRRSLFDAQKQLKEKILNEIVVDGGGAPLSEPKWDLMRECMAELKRLIECNLTKEDRKEAEDIILTVWRNGFPKLPGYKTEDQIQNMKDSKDWERLLKIGYINNIDEKPADVYYPPRFTCEVGTAIEIR